MGATTREQSVSGRDRDVEPSVREHRGRPQGSRATGGPRARDQTRDRRVLSAWECCDNCINDALASLHEICKFLVDKQVELSDLSEEPLFQLINAMRLGISQFLTFEQRLKSEDATRYLRPPDVRQTYFDALEELRGHLSRCLGQIAVLAGMEVPSEGLVANYQGPWQLEAYVVRLPGDPVS